MTSQGVVVHERRFKNSCVRAPPAGSGFLRVRSDGLRFGASEFAHERSGVQVRLARTVRRHQGGHRGRFRSDHTGIPQVCVCLLFYTLVQKLSLNLKSEL